jgi:outer membrane immunogenic protein
MNLFMPAGWLTHSPEMVGKKEIVMKKILTAALLATVATSAFAADLPTRKGPPPAPVYVPPPFTWTGFYVGVNGGYGFGSGGNATFGNPSGGLVGGTAGYNYQIGQFVTGVEASLDWADLTKTQILLNGSSTSQKVDSLGNILARFGLAADRALFYVAGGYAGGDVRGTDLTAAGLSYSNSGWQNGWALGGGVEYAFTNNISAKAEYLFSQLSDKTYFAGSPDVVKAGLNVNTFKVGVNYKF